MRQDSHRSSGAIRIAAAVMAAGVVLAAGLIAGCGGGVKATGQAEVRAAAATEKSVVVVRLEPGDPEFDALAALHVSNALVAILREQGMFMRVDSTFDLDTVPSDADYVIYGTVRKGVPKSKRNTAAVKRLLLTVSLVGASFRRTVRDHDYELTMTADMIIRGKGLSTPFREMTLKVKAEDTYSDVDRDAVNARVCRVAERNLAVMIVNDFFDALVGKAR